MARKGSSSPAVTDPACPRHTEDKTLQRLDAKQHIRGRVEIAAHRYQLLSVPTWPELSPCRGASSQAGSSTTRLPRRIPIRSWFYHSPIVQNDPPRPGFDDKGLLALLQRDVCQLDLEAFVGLCVAVDDHFTLGDPK